MITETCARHNKTVHVFQQHSGCKAPECGDWSTVTVAWTLSAPNPNLAVGSTSPMASPL